MNSKSSKPTARSRLRIAAGLVIATSASASSAALLTEDFEGQQIDPRISLASVGGFTSAPRVQSFAGLGGAGAFGFGRSNCRANCFDAHTSSLIVDLGASSFIQSISFDEIETLTNWGSGGGLFLDGNLFGTSTFSFGRLPYNDARADTTARHHEFIIEKEAQIIELRVRDITDLSEIFVDNLVIASNAPTPVASPSTGALALVTGMSLFGALRRRGRERNQPMMN